MQKDINRVIKMVEIAKEQLKKVDNVLYSLLEEKIEIMKEKNDIKGLEKLMDSIPECFTRYTIFNIIEELKLK